MSGEDHSAGYHREQPDASKGGSRQQQQQQQAAANRLRRGRIVDVSDTNLGRPSPTRTLSSTGTSGDRPQQQQQLPVSGTKSSHNRRSRGSPYYPQETAIDDSFADERLTSSAASWEEAQSFDSEDQQQQQQQQRTTKQSLASVGGSRSSSHHHDRRKQFDTTTPTLIDEEEDEDDSEMLQLQHSYDQGNNDSEMRRTPGATMYKSILGETATDDSTLFVRRTPGASAMHRSGPPGMGLAASNAATATITSSSLGTTSSGGAVDETLGTSEGLGFRLGLPTTMDRANDFASPAKETQQQQQQQGQQQRISWDQYQPPQGGVEANQSATASTSGTPSRQPEPRGLFSFESWATTKSSEVEALATGRTNTGTFSPNILRLTEAIGNLLQEDEDDAYALEIPNAFRGSGETNASSNVTGIADFDWTGAYVFDSEHRKKPAVPSRSAVGSEKASRRRGSGDVRNTYFNPNQQNDKSGSLLHTAHQPKPRRNEAFEFAKPSRTTPSDERESPQLLIFGGAFAPPGSTMNSGGFMRPVASLQGAESTASTGGHRNETVSPFLPAVQQDIYRPRFASMPGYPEQFQQQQQHQSGNFQPGVASHMAGSGYREHSLSYDSYQSMSHTPVQMDGPYFQGGVYRASSPAYGMFAPMPSYASQQSEMQATARVFIPHRTRTATPTYGSQIPRPPHWQPPPGFATAPDYETSLEQGGWHSNPSYHHGSSGFGYGTPMQHVQSHGDPRVGMSPSPHASSWQNQQQPPIQHISEPPAAYRNVTQQQYRNESVSSAAEVTSPSPHPSTAGSEHSGTMTQQRGAVGRKETKRKQRAKKKALKIETIVDSISKPSAVSKKKGEASRPGSATHSVDGNDEARVSPAEDPVDTKRLELVESPATRIAFKEFYRAFRGEERGSFQNAEEFALKALQDDSLPEAVHWRVYLELADLAKRSNRYVEARCLYQKVCELQPYASQGWLEYSKLEEECGRMNRVMNILHQGLQYCELSENLLTRAVKHYEKIGSLDNARGLLAKLKHVGIEKVWRTVLEGALLEARAGNISTSRRVLKYLMHHVPWYGPLYLEAYRLEKDQGNTLDALHIVERGLQAIPRYGPLWFGAFRLCEELDLSQNLYHLPSTMNMIERAATHISKELVWKVHLDAAQMLERSALEQGSSESHSLNSLLDPARRRIALTILTSPNNLRWKVWLAAGRMELELGNTERARSLFVRAHEVVPGKGRSSTLLECARLEDFVGDTNLARAILCKGRTLYCNDWKVWLESILLEIRVGNHRIAMEMCENALEIHQGTGRLWATLVQLRQFYGHDEAQQIALRRALNAVPKSGEVWCEGGRIHLNPFSDTFDLDRARRHLYFATRFTPQYGDGFVETIRSELLRQWIAPIASYVWEKTKYGFKTGLGGAFEDGLTKYVTDVSLAISVAARPQRAGVSHAPLPKLLYRDIIEHVRQQLDPGYQQSIVDLNDVWLACVNADPNYGLLWFHCRRKATDTPRRIIEDASGIITEELRSYAHLYLAAMVRREAILSTVGVEKPVSLSNDDIEVNDPKAVEWEDYADAKLHAAPSLETIFNPTDPTTGLDLLESTARGPLFATGLTKLNKRQPIDSMSLSDRRRALFGIDALFP
jgi:tetratricopeptide (TPR) repeat protein